MEFFFADDTIQNSSREGMGKILGFGGIFVPAEVLGSLEKEINGICDPVLTPFVKTKFEGVFGAQLSDYVEAGITEGVRRTTGVTPAEGKFPAPIQIYCRRHAQPV